ncbi:YihY/virulence factor BrkB family protein [Oceanobacillus saliphilus]|uniref:YihY/virulence factor BrkB family protein n=1 Tax=Oceanobacillus saliphilus TaxID=2925834 RepID=UPI00201E0F27|nr:YihY/virulence factor BrkB family protein [Oceanobacillus saliphilus]
MAKIKKFYHDFMVRFQENNVTLLAASLAYYFLLAVFPLLIVAFAIIPYFNIRAEDAMSFIASIVPGELASIFEDNIVSLVETPRGGLLTVGIIGALWSASNGINAFIKASNQAYDVEETRSFVVTRFIAFTLTISMILAVVIAILLPVFGDVILGFLVTLLGISSDMTVLLQILRYVISILVITALLMALYHVAPNKKIPFKHIIPGALTASILWQVISFGFSIYISNFGNYSATYGSLGGIIVLMIWFFLTGVILLIGAIINVMYHKKEVRENAELHKAANI